MTFRMPSGQGLPRPRRLGRGPKLLLPMVLLVVAALTLGSVFTSFYTDLLWFRSVNFSRVFTTQLRTRLLLFAVFGALTAVVVAVNVVVAYRLRPPFRPISAEQQGLERYRVGLDPYRRWILLGVAGLLGLMAGSSAGSHWSTWLLWRNAVPFGQTDPQFHKDISYFTFTYPFQRFLLGFAFFIVVLSLLAAAAAHYLYGGLRLQSPGDKLTPAARAHVSVLLGFFVLLKAAAYWLDRYGLSFSRRGFVNTGASYTDINAVLPAKTILIFVALICAALFFANVFSKGWALPSIGLGLLALCALLIGGLYPAIIQQFQVKPSEVDKERVYINRHIAATRAAYGIRPGSDVSFQNYGGTLAGNLQTLRSDKVTLPNVRLVDPNIVQQTYQQLQGFKNFYAFPDVLDIDRYNLGGTQQEQVVAVRDINVGGLTANQQNWINSHLVYTHGYGIVAAPSNIVDADGKPQFNESDIPVRGNLNVTQPRVYFGENSPTYSVVGAPGKSTPRELDYPTSGASGQQKNTYDGKGGVAMGSRMRQLLYAIRFKEKNLLLSSGVNSDSRILYIREPRARVQKVAPWLTVDGDSYPAVVNGRIVWILDGYTTSDGYPYSERRVLGDVTADALTRTSSSVAAQGQREVNYIRNSVKAVVDAYDGSVKLYRWGPRDPVLETWAKAFPGIIQDTATIPPELRAHFRYPEDFFKVQRDLLTKFHVTDPAAFYSGSDYWKVPADPTKTAGSADQPPYYLTMGLPGDAVPSFRLTSALVANARPNMAAFVAVNSDPAGPTYGKITVLQLPSNTQADGPGQVANNFESFTPAATELSLLRRGGSDVDLGNLLTLPLGGGLIYIEPVYVKSTGATSYPTLKRVLVEFNGAISYKPTLSEALDQVFKTTTSTPPSSGGTGPVTGNLSTAVKSAIAQASQAYADGQAALKAGDFSAYGQAQSRLQATLGRLTALTRATPTPTPTPTGSGSPTPGTTPSATPSTAVSPAALSFPVR
jgi:uncharacterized protein